MIVSIHQPSYWPWLGLLDKIAKSDVFVILDDVRINKRSYQKRNIFWCNNKKKYLILKAKFSDNSIINEIKLLKQDEPINHLRILKQWYKDSLYFNEIINYIKKSSLFKQTYEYLVDVLIDTIKISCDILKIDTITIKSSEIDYKGKKSDMNLSICKKMGANIYLSGKGALDYMKEDDFKSFTKENIKIKFQNFEYPIYQQYNNCDFISGLAGLDILFWNGISKSRKIFWDNVYEDKTP